MPYNDSYRSEARQAPSSDRSSLEGPGGRAGRSAGERGPREENLALIYQGFLTGIVRVQTGKSQIMDSEAFRKRMKEGLREAERRAVKRGYQNEDIADAGFAIIAFLDETVLTSNDPSRTQWAKKYLLEELFGQAIGGEIFFERLERLRARRDSPQLADLLEVYYLCLLLGYEGRHAVGPKAELRMIMDNLRERIEHIRGRNEALSPEGRLPVEPPRAPPQQDLLASKLRVFAIVAVVFALLCFFLFKGMLSWQGNDVRTELGRGI